MSSFAQILVGLEAPRQVPAVEALARALPAAWVRQAVEAAGRQSRRHRLLPAELTLWLVILLGLFRRHSYVNLLEMLGEAGWGFARWGGKAPPSSRALTKARDRLGPEPLTRLFGRSARAWADAAPGRFVGPHRVYALDGASFLVPDTPANRQAFGAPASTRGRTGYPQMRAVALLDVGSHLVVAARTGPFREGEVTLAKRLVGDVPRGGFVVMDRLFRCYELLHRLVAERGAHFLLRLKSNHTAQRVRALGRDDLLVDVPIPRALRRLDPDLPATWTLREIGYRVPHRRERVRVLTSCLDPQVLPAAAVPGLYWERWEEETALDEIKTHQCECAVVSRPTALRSQTPERVRQEFLGLLLAYNLTRVLMAEAAAPRRLSPLRLGFLGAITRLREAVRDMMGLPALRLPDRYDRLLRAIARALLPPRRRRRRPRAVKVKMSKYPVYRAA